MEYDLIKLKHRFKTVMVPLVDQLIVSGGNFLLTVLLARKLEIEAFGIFSIYWIVNISIVSVMQALIYSPLYTLSSKYNYYQKKTFENLTIVQLLGLIIFISIVTICLSVICDNYYHKDTLDSVILFNIYFSSFSLYDYVRKRLFILGRNDAALKLDLSIYLLIFVYLILQKEIELGYLILFISSVYYITSVLTAIKIKIFNVDIFSVFWREGLKDIFWNQWEYSKWLLASSVIQFLNGNAIILVTGQYLSVVAVGYIRMAQNITGIINPIYTAIDNHIQIYLSKSKVNDEQSIYNKKVNLIYSSLSLLVLFLITIGYIFNESIMLFVYDENSENLLGIYNVMLLLSIFILFNFLERLLLKVELNSKLIFNGYVFGVVISAVIIIPSIISSGSVGAVFVMLVSQASIFIFTRISKRKYG